jgi:ethanolamine ammonia-lyase large subunit
MDDDELRRTLVLANAFKEGDLAVGGTADDRLREEARAALAAATVGDVRRVAIVADGVTAALEASRDRQHDADLDGLTVGAIKAILLGPGAPAWVDTYGDALGSETIAAVAKVLADDELSAVARALFHRLGDGPVAIGSPGHFGSRIQPNSAGDDEEEILFSILEGLAFGCGDVIVGLNPAADDLDTIVRLEQLLESVVRRLDLPTRYCVLSDIVKQDAARARCRVDVGFQSLAGTSRALAGMVGLDVDGLVELARGFSGLYFETGQGSEVTNGTADGVDMVTLEARTYGVARHVRRRLAPAHSQLSAFAGRPGRPGPWTIVNDVAGFIGPEVFQTGRQLERACFEDIVMAKLHGLTMGLDVCATFHMGIPPRELRELTGRIVERAAPAYLMAVAGNADPMLGYLTTSFRQHPELRRRTAARMTSRMETRLQALGVLSPADGDALPDEASVATLYAGYRQANGERRTRTSLEDEARRRLSALRERGLDLGANTAAAAAARVDAIYRHARTALYASMDEGVVRDATVSPLRVRTLAADRDDYLAHPDRGERLASVDAVRLQGARRGVGTRVQIVVSDGLNANAINEQLRPLLQRLRHRLQAAAGIVTPGDVVVENGRVRVGYEIGALVGAEVVIHVIGERPGTGLNTASAYLTYGRDEAGRPRWSRALDHSATTAVCGIHPRGKHPDSAADEIARIATRILAERRSGVALGRAAS